MTRWCEVEAQHVILGAGLPQRGSHRRGVRIDRVGELVGDRLPLRGGRIGLVLQIDEPEPHRELGVDELPELPSATGDRGAECLVPIDQRLERRLQGAVIDRSVERPEHRTVQPGPDLAVVGQQPQQPLPDRRRYSDALGPDDRVGPVGPAGRFGRVGPVGRVGRGGPGSGGIGAARLAGVRVAGVRVAWAGHEWARRGLAGFGSAWRGVGTCRGYRAMDRGFLRPPRLRALCANGPRLGPFRHLCAQTAPDPAGARAVWALVRGNDPGLGWKEGRLGTCARKRPGFGWRGRFGHVCAETARIGGTRR